MKYVVRFCNEACNFCQIVMFLSSLVSLVSFEALFLFFFCTFTLYNLHIDLLYICITIHCNSLILLTQCLSSSVPYNNVAVSAESSEREGDEASVVSSSPNSPPRSSVRVLRTNLFSRAHAFQTFLHLVSLTLSYFLMLIAMTFNSWLFGSVVGGLAAG